MKCDCCNKKVNILYEVEEDTGTGLEIYEICKECFDNDHDNLCLLSVKKEVK